MSNSYFQFKRFIVRQDKCAMKVGTDGVLLGAWAPIDNAENVLDIGCGTGLISLMLAQRSSAFITAIDIDTDAIEQCRENVIDSPWPDRIDVHHTSLLYFQPDYTFDVIVSNPPYFRNSLRSPVEKRSTARHTDSLSYEDLLSNVKRLLSARGLFSVIIPYDAVNEILFIAENHGLFPVKRTDIRTTPLKDPKRVLVSFSFSRTETDYRDLVIELSRHVYSEEYISLTRDFYLHM